MLFGNINKSMSIDFTNPLLFDTRNSTSNTISGFYFNTGLIFHGFERYLKPKSDNMTLGVVVSTPSKFNSSISGKVQPFH